MPSISRISNRHSLLFLIIILSLVIASLFFFISNNESDNHKTESMSQILDYDKDFEEVMNRTDQNISEKNMNISNWKVFTHPDGIYSLMYPPFLTPQIVEQYEGPFKTVKFVPNDSYIEENGSREFPNLGISFYAMGGGSWCTVSCMDVNQDLPKIEVKSAIEPTFEEMTDYIVINDVPQIYVGILANFLPYTESRYEIRIFSKYNAANQREILRQMYSSFAFDKERIRRLVTTE